MSSDREVVGTTLGAVVEAPLGTYVGSEMRPLEGCTDVSVDGKFYVLLDHWKYLISGKTKVLN